MLFCSAPMQTDTVQRTKAPVVPRAPIEAPSAAIRKPGFASATTKPSHQLIALRSCRSSTCADATPSPRIRWTNLFPRGGFVPSVTDVVNWPIVGHSGPAGVERGSRLYQFVYH